MAGMMALVVDIRLATSEIGYDPMQRTTEGMT